MLSLRRESSAIAALLGGQLVMFIGIAAVFPVAPLYVREHGGGAVAAALFIAGALVANSLVQIPAGWLVDRIGRRPVLLTSRATYGLLALLLFADRGTLFELSVLRTLMGAAAGAYIPALLATITDLTPAERRAERFSQLQAAEMTGLLLGPLAGGVIALWRTSAIFLISGGLVLLGVAVQTRVPETGRRGLTAGAAKTAAPSGWWRARGIVVAALGLATLGMVFSMYDVVWPQYLQARGAGTVLIGVSISLFALPMMLLATRGGRFADRANRRVILGCCFAVTGACCISYPLLRSIPVIITVGTVEALAVLMCEPSLYATVADATPAEARGRAMGIGGFFQLGGSGVGAAVLGSAYAIREGLPFWLGGGGMIVTAGVCALAIPARRPGARSVADDSETGGFVVGALEHGDHARGAQVDRPLFARKLDEVDIAAGDGDGSDRVGDLELDEDVGAVAET